MTPAFEHIKRAVHTVGDLWTHYVEPLLDEAAKYTGIPILLLSTALLVLSYRIAGRVLRTATQMAIAVAIALGAAYVRGALVH